MKKQFTYTCKFCHVTRTFEFEAGDEEPTIINVDLWLKNMCCNRCAEYHINRRKLSQQMGTVCRAIAMAREHGGSQLAEAEAACRVKLKDICGKFAFLVCDYYHKQTVMDDDFWQMIFEKPDNFVRVLALYVHGIGTI